MGRVAKWLREEPVRVYLYTVSLSVLTLLTTLGIVNDTYVPVIVGLISPILSVPLSESLRSRVTPYRPEPEVEEEPEL